MPNPNGSEIITQKHVRFFHQPGGPHPDNPVFYSGTSGTYMVIEQGSNPKRGGASAINVHDPKQRGRYRRVGRNVSPADFANASVRFMQMRASLPKHLVEIEDCVNNYYQVVGDCKDPSDFLGGWNAYVKIYGSGEVTDGNEAGGSFESDEALMDEVPQTFYGGISNMGKLGFAEEGATTVYSQVKGITFGNRVSCGACGPRDNGTKLVYAVTDNTVASPGQAPAVYYSTDYGETFTEQAITSAVATDVPVGIFVVGQNLVVVFDNGTTGGYYYTEINEITGIPDNSWTKVTTGFVTGKAPQDFYAPNASEVWFCGEGGYVYKSTSIANGVTPIDRGVTTTNNLLRIHGYGNVIVAGGASGTLIYSRDGGSSWSSAATAFNDIDGNVTALWVADDYLWWVGGSNSGGSAAYVEYTPDGGEATWTSKNLETWVNVDDIVFATDEVGYISAATTGPVGKIYATWNGGNLWTRSSPRVLNFPTYDRGNRLAVPDVPNINTAINRVAVGGLAGNGSDGLILIAKANTK